MASYAAANRALVEKCRELRPEIVWFDKADWIQPATLETLRDLGAFLVSHNTDALCARRSSGGCC